MGASVTGLLCLVLQAYFVAALASKMAEDPHCSSVAFSAFKLFAKAS